MNVKTITVAENAEIVIIVDAPKVSYSETDKPGDLLLHFFRALGWNGKDYLDPGKIRTSRYVYDGLYDQIHERYPNTVAVGMFLVNSGPGVDDHIKPGKVHLLDGWVKPAEDEHENLKGGDIDAA